MLYEEQEAAVNALKKAFSYVKQAHDDAEAKHDSYGDYYMDGGLYEIMQQTETLMDDMTQIINGFEEENGRPHWSGE